MEQRIEYERQNKGHLDHTDIRGAGKEPLRGAGDRDQVGGHRAPGTTDGLICVVPRCTIPVDVATARLGRRMALRSEAVLVLCPGWRIRRGSEQR